MSENPYAPPAIPGPIESEDAKPSDTEWGRVFKWAPFSISGGLLTAYFHMSMYHSGRLSPEMAYAGMGAIFGASLLCGVHASGLLKGGNIQRMFVSAALFCSCVAGFAAVAFLAGSVRTLRLYPDWPWTFSMAIYLPICICLILMVMLIFLGLNIFLEIIWKIYPIFP